MHNILAKIFEKKGIKSVDELTREERSTFEMYESILARKEMTIADIREFLSAQLSIIENKWRDLNLDQSKKAELVPYHTVYKVVLQAIDAPQAERVALEKLLVQQIK